MKYTQARGLKGKTMANKLMYIRNVDTKITPLKFTISLKYLDTQLNEITNQNSIKIPKVVMPTNKNI